MQTKRLRAGLVGTGFIAASHARVLKSIHAADLVAVYDVDTARAESFARRFGIPQTCGSLQELFDAADVAHVLVPAPMHVEVTQACLNGGRHVLLEKPAAVDGDGCRQIRAEAQRTGKVVGVNHNLTFHPSFARLLDAVRDWRLGAVQHAIAVVNVPLRQLTTGQHGHWMFRAPPNILLEQAVHPLSQIHALLGGIVTAACKVSGSTTLNSIVLYDTWQISLECERGTAQILLSFGREFAEHRIDVIGQDASASVDLLRNTLTMHRKSPNMEPIDHFMDALRGGSGLISQGWANLLNYVLAFVKLRAIGDTFSAGMYGSINAFYEALAAGQPVPCGIDEGAAVIDACEKIYAAHEFQSAPTR